MIRRLLCVCALAIGAGVAWLPAQIEKPVERIAIRAAHLIDGTGGPTINDAVVVVEGDRITAAGTSSRIPSNARVIELGSATLLPGLIDAHTHITGGDPREYYEKIFRRSPMDDAVEAHVYARRTLEAGFTTIRDVGADEYIDVALRKSIDAGTSVGPRMQVSTMAIGATGGHADLTGFSPYIEFKHFTGLADGVDEIRKAVRVRVKNGADLIKVIATAGVLTEEGSAGAPQYSQEELNAVVQEASMWEKKVAAHAHGAEGIKRAVRAGVASIEHGSLIDAEGIKLMKERGTYLVADIYNDDYILSEYARLNFPAKIIGKEKQVGQAQRENFQKAVRAGVKVAFGTDAGVYPHGWNARQFAHMVKWGLTPMQAIQSATVNAADLLGWSDRVGKVAPDMYADLIAVDGDPLKDITVLERVKFVMKGGRVYKQ